MFDLATGNLTSSLSAVWRADSWLHLHAANGMASILMPKDTILAFATFVRNARNYPQGRHSVIYGELKFDSEEHAAFDGSTTVNVLVGGEAFVYAFNIELTLLEPLAQYLEQNSDDAEEADVG